MPERFGVMLLSGTHERAHYAFVLATAAAALGRRVVLFATNAGCRALLENWAGLEQAARDGMVRGRGVAGLDELRAAAVELQVRLVVCEAGLRSEALTGAPLMPGVEIGGVATLLEAAAGGQIVTL